MKRAIGVILLVLALCSLSAAAGDIEGVYDCQGTGPGGGGAYQGSVAIMKNGASYQVVWTLGATVYLGVGLLQGDQFSVGYADANKNSVGIVVYQVSGDILTGTWAPQGSAQTGTETLTRRR